MNKPFIRQRRLISSLTLTLLVVVLVVAGCSNNGQSSNSTNAANTGNEQQQSTSAGDAAKEQALKVAISADSGLDQLDAGTYKGSMTVHAMIYDGLVEYGEKGEIKPALAESWEISEDGKVYTFHLRQGVKFSDGTPFNAEAVKFSFERWIKDPANTLNVATSLEALEVVDEHTVTMNFSKSYYPFLTELSFARPVRIISPSAVEPAGDVNGQFVSPIGTGAWMAESYKTEQEAVLVANPYYWGEKPKLTKIVLKVIPDPQSRVMALQSGDIDIAGGQLGKIPVESIPVIEGDASLSLERTPGTNSHFMIFNYDTPALQELNVRKAINLAINKASIVNDLMNGIGSEATGLFPMTVPYVTESNQTWYGFEPEEAKRLLAEAGYGEADGEGVVSKSGEPLELNLVLQQAEFPEWKPFAELIQSELQEIGIRVNLQVLEPNAYYDALWKTREYDLILYRTYDDAYNPHSFLLSLFHATGEAPAVVWSDAKLEALIDQAVGTTNLEERQTAYDSIFAQMYEQAMFAAIYFPDDVLVRSQRVTGYKAGYTTFTPIFWNQLNVGEQ
ncbi:nickel ABC transporter substrate-binding protein [Paenibacillus antibioticophila]|uniref:nickel ABC transporter substrate-binding protein n=1 Tax=Paenibacillus antibioticophila TaxID=1274374 RepID=UPI0005CA7FCD|nr:nickel ABC transporter substrate-binding protein [Paenibacillus antibioticophila]